MPAAISACGTAPVREHASRRGIVVQSSSPCLSCAPTTRPPSSSRAETQRREHARAGRARGAAQDRGRARLRGSTASVPGTSTRPPRGPMQPTWVAAALRHHLVEHAELAQRVVRVGDQPVAADLVAREAVLVDETHVEAGAASVIAAALPAGRRR
jgi:hypothetical protein